MVRTCWRAHTHVAYLLAAVGSFIIIFEIFRYSAAIYTSQGIN